MRRYLVVANQTLGGPALAEKIRGCMAEGPCSFHIVVPATRPIEPLVWTEGQAHDLAEERLERALTWFQRTGADVTGEVGDARPMLAIGDALLAGEFDEIIVSTLPPGVSRWIRQDLPARARRRFAIPVSHVFGDRAKVRQTG